MSGCGREWRRRIDNSDRRLARGAGRAVDGREQVGMTLNSKFHFFSLQTPVGELHAFVASTVGWMGHVDATLDALQRQLDKKEQ